MKINDKNKRSDLISTNKFQIFKVQMSIMRTHNSKILVFTTWELMKITFL